MSERKKRLIEEMGDAETVERAAKVRHRKVYGNFCERGDGGAITRVNCRFCQTPIQDWVPIRSEFSTKLDGKIVERIQVTLMPLPNFATVRLVMEDGAVYEPNMCKSCAAKFDFADSELHEACYMADVESWARGQKAVGSTPELFHVKHSVGLRRKVKGAG